jgi:molybdate transport system substrate-binding protein
VSHAEPRCRLPCGAGLLARALALLAAPLLLACAPPREVLVGVAASLSEPMAAVASAYEEPRPGVRLRLALGASNVLAEQLRAGAPLDLLLSADPRVVEQLVAEGLVGAQDRARLAGNRLVVLVRRDFPGALTSPADLRAAEIRRVAVPDAAVPIGRHARDWLAARGLLAELEPRLVATADARATLAAVDAGDVDAAIAYATDARLAASARVAFEIPPDEQPAIAYEAALRSDASDEARDFFAFLAGGGATSALAAAGFPPPPGAP